MRKKYYLLALMSVAVVLISALLVFFFKYRLQRVTPGCDVEFDLLIEDVEIVDGSGKPPFHADVGINNKRIACISDLVKAKGKVTINATGLTLAPGFIDVHTHIEHNVSQGASFFAPNFVKQGVTTVITGNCGRSFLEIGKFFNRLEKNGMQVNVATLIGHNTVRSQVMKQRAAPPTGPEMSAMASLVNRAMRDGALGLSTGLVYVPGTFAKTDEIASLAKVAAGKNGLYVSHIRDEGAGGVAALQEAIFIGDKAGVQVHISHFKAQGPLLWGSATARLDLVRAAKDRGVMISADQYPYTASSTGIAVLLPPWLSEGDFGRAKLKLQDPTTRGRIRNEMLAQLKINGWTDYSFARVAYYKFDPSLVGLTIADITHKREASGKSQDGVTESEHQAETIIDLYSHGGAQMIFFDMSEDDVETIMKNPDVMFGSDSGVRDENLTVLPHPRGFGTFPRILGVYVREKTLLSLEEAVRRMTSLPAATFGLSGRGLIRENNWADLVIFDRKQIVDTATFEKPLSPPQGIRYVIVNGSIVLDQEKLTNTLPGMVLRHSD